MDNLLPGIKLEQNAAGATSAGSDVTGTAIDMQGYSGVVFFCTIATANAGNYLKAQAGATSGGASNDLAGTKTVAASDGQLVKLEISRPLDRWVKPVIVRGGANTVTGPIYAIRYKAGVEPQDNTPAVIAVSPAQGTP